jgi:hypothetical protein
LNLSRRYVPKGFLRQPVILRQVVTIEDLDWNTRNRVYALKNLDKKKLSPEDFQRKYPSKIKIDLAYVRGSNIYDLNLNSLKNYALGLLFILNQHISNFSISKILEYFHSDMMTQKSWLSFTNWPRLSLLHPRNFWPLRWGVTR